MENKKFDGGPAFPCDGITTYKGVSVRDYFATHAKEEDIKAIMWEYELKISRYEAKYIYADEMIEAREK